MNNQSGLSAVELLITLFIAAMFLMSGYLLWGLTQQSSAEAKQSAIASNAAYNYVRRYTSSVGCNTTPVNAAVPENTTGLPNPSVTVSTSCQGALSSLGIVKVTSTVTYGSNPVKSVSHVVYATSN